MDFDLSEEQRLLQESLTRLLADTYDFEKRKAYAKSEMGFSEAMWRRYAELGLLGASFSEEDGGFGGGPVETMLAMEAFGKALAVEPYFAGVVLAGAAVRLAGSAEQRAAILSAVASGGLRLAFAHAERHSGFNAFDVTTKARKDGDAYVLDGEKSLVLNGDGAHKLVVLARTAGERRDRAGLALFLVDGAAPGVSRRGYPTQDGLRAAEIALTNVRVPAADVLGDPAGAAAVVARVLDEGIAALCAEAVGAMGEAIESTVAYLKTRKQFGVPIGSFQVLQHRASDMIVALEQARSMMMFAAMSASDPDEASRSRAISAAKVQICKSARFVGQAAVQMHGGIAMTMELKLGHLFKRLSMIEMAYGDADHHLKRLAAAPSLFD